MQDTLNRLQDLVNNPDCNLWNHMGLVKHVMDTEFHGWGSATATAAEWDVVALMTDTNCKHPKWTPWPFDYTKETCAHCGEERRYIKGRTS